MKAKNDIAVCPFSIAIDQREKAPFSFSGMSSILAGCRGGENGQRLIVRTEKKFLQTGDYSVLGFEGRVAVERKSLEDLYGTIGQNRDRFEAEFRRLNEMDVAAVIIEAGWLDVRDPKASRGGAWRSRLSPKSVFGTIQQWTIRYPKVHWYACGDRQRAEVGTFRFLERWWRELLERKGN